MGIGIKVIEKPYRTYSFEFGEKKFAYDGEKSLYIVGPLPQNKLQLAVVIEESKTVNLMIVQLNSYTAC